MRYLLLGDDYKLREITQKVELFGADNRVPQNVWLPSKFGIK